MQRIIMHFDMNSYFASVEQQANPRLRGKPLGIAATLAPGGCMIATSKEAKAKGIVTGMRVKDGLAIDPNLIVVEVDPPKYQSTTERIFGIVAEYAEDIEPYSIDEAFVDLTGTAASLDDAVALVATLKRRIHDEVGDWLTCSAGIAWTRWLAKFASDTAPKAGLVVFTPESLPGYLLGRGVTEAWGIAKGFGSRLNALGIATLDELARYPVTNLVEALGVKGYELWANVNGIELGGVQAPHQPKSVGHTHVLRVRTKDPLFHRGVLMKLCEKTGRRLRQLGLEAHGLAAFANCVERPQAPMREAFSCGGHRLFQRGLTSSREIYRLAWSMLEPELRGLTVVWLGVTTYRLAPRSNQLSLWPMANHTVVEEAVDEMNERYGSYVVQWGAMAGMRKHAPERIGYRKSVDIPQPL